MGEGRGGRSPRATGTAGRGKGGEGVRASEGRRARVRAEELGGLGRSPRALASRRGRRPSPTRLAGSLTLSPAASARRLRGGEVLPPPLRELPSPSGPEAAASPRRSARLSRRRRLLASSGAAAGSDCATRTPPGPRCTSARLTPCVSTQTRVAGLAGNWSASRSLLRRRRNHNGKYRFFRHKAGFTPLPKD
ncbi:uncharacterized protein LOC144338337 [Macaca mulatta]